jgi:hypothetical protein
LPTTFPKYLDYSINAGFLTALTPMNRVAL